MFIIAIGSLTKTDRKIKIKEASHRGEHDVGAAQRKGAQRGSMEESGTEYSYSRAARTW